MKFRFPSRSRTFLFCALLGSTLFGCSEASDDSDGGKGDGDSDDMGDDAGVGGTYVPGSGGNGSGADTGSGGSGGVNPPLDYIFPDGRGPKVAFSTYEAEAMTTSAEILGPTRDFGQFASEASGRMAVRLDAQGENVSFENKYASNSIVVRYAIPNNGLDYWTKLTVLVDGVERAKLDVTSRYSWSYRNQDDNIFNTPDQKNPGAGTAHHFFDETRALVGDIPVGATVTIQKSAGDDAAFYVIDLVEMEQVADPLPQPAGFRNVMTDCGATNNGDQDDDTGAFQDCLNDPGEGIYIPPGVFHIKSAALENNRTIVRGAGMWHSTIMGANAHFVCWNSNCEYYDFSVFGDTTARYDDANDAGFDGGNNDNVILDNIWVEHRRVGYWTNGQTNNLQIKNSRFRNLHADAVNLYGGASNSVVDNCHIRNTGDDALAAWSHDYDGRPANSNNVFSHNYIQVPWKANCIGLYGGDDMSVTDNVCADTLQYPGILLGRLFSEHDFGGLTHIERNTLLRAGGHAYGADQGAFKFYARDSNIDNVRVKDLDIISPTYSGIHIQGGAYVGNTEFDDVLIESPGTSGFFLSGSSKGAMDAIAVVQTGGGQGIATGSGAEFSVNKIGDANSGW